jgi:hypothetical protein
MPSRRTLGEASRKRFSISLDAHDYEQLSLPAGRRKPPLTSQYVVNYAAHRLLEDVSDLQLAHHLGDPLARGERP